MTEKSFPRPLTKPRFVPAKKSCSQIWRTGLIHRGSLCQRGTVLLSKKPDWYFGYKIQGWRPWHESFEFGSSSRNHFPVRQRKCSAGQHLSSVFTAEREVGSSRHLEREALQGTSPRHCRDDVQTGEPGSISPGNVHAGFSLPHPRLFDEDTKRRISRCH